MDNLTIVSGSTSDDRTVSEIRYLVVSADSHAGPSLAGDLRPYCPAKYVEQYDEFSREVASILSAGTVDPKLQVGSDFPFGGPEANQRSKLCPGLHDPDARRRDMDAEGIAADVIFAGGGNDQPVPFVGFGTSAGPGEISGELRAVGGQIWNEWLVDFITGAPERHVGVMQIPIWDIDVSLQTLKRGRDAGLTAANLPAPRRDIQPYNDTVYEPFWSACEELGVTLMTHAGGGETPLGSGHPGGAGVAYTETHYMVRRSLPQLIFGGVFERHPGLHVIYTELRASWVPQLLRDMDSIYFGDATPEGGHCPMLSKPPSDYWHANCYNSGSFLAPFEVAMRQDIGIRNLLWGSDYPHTEGTWPRTKLAMRNTFCHVPEAETRMILGETAVDVLGLDRVALRKIADRIGPLPSEIATPLAPQEFPERPGLAFRRYGAFA